MLTEHFGEWQGTEAFSGFVNCMYQHGISVSMMSDNSLHLLVDKAIATELGAADVLDHWFVERSNSTGLFAGLVVVRYSKETKAGIHYMFTYPLNADTPELMAKTFYLQQFITNNCKLKQ